MLPSRLPVAVLFAVLLLPAGGVAQTAMEARPTIYYIGDSTVRNGSGNGANGQWGWGDHTTQYFDTTSVRVENRALGGRSSRTYIAQGHWGRVLETLEPGDVVIMQFGHNDASPVNDASRARGTLHGTGEDSVEIDNLLTGEREVVHTFGWYLRRFVAESRARGATPVVASLVPRNRHEGGVFGRERESWAGWAEEVARQEEVAFLDLNELVAREYDRLGPEAVARLFEGDHVHTSLAGARLTAGVVVEALRDLDPNPVAAYLLPGQPAP